MIFSRKRLAVLALVAVSTGALWPQDRPETVEAVSVPAHPSAPATADVTRVVQSCLRNFGYAIAVDSVYGPQTTKAVTHFQRVNGLLPDGVAGPKTQRKMVEAGCALTAPVAGPPAPPRATAGVPGQCDSYRALVEAHGLSWSFFGPVMWRESRCTPSAYNGRGADQSYGLLQINTKGALWGELQRRCGLSSKDQLLDPATNIACAAALYRAYGTRPWS